MNNPRCSQVVVSIAIGCALALSAVSNGGEKGAMVPFVIKESRSEHFIIIGQVVEGRTIRIWFRSCEKGDRGKQFVKRASYVCRYYGPGIHEGDEIIRIEGEPVEDMAGMANFAMDQRAKKKASFSVEVRSPGSTEVRKITVFGVPYAVITPDEAKASTPAPKPETP